MKLIRLHTTNEKIVYINPSQVMFAEESNIGTTRLAFPEADIFVTETIDEIFKEDNE